MSTPSAGIENEYLRYLDFAENQHLQALNTLCQQTEDLGSYSQLLAYKGQMAELIRRRRNLFPVTEGISLEFES